MVVSGPSFQSPAEIRFFGRRGGCDWHVCARGGRRAAFEYAVMALCCVTLSAIR
jgi:hypothetical protein